MLPSDASLQSASKVVNRSISLDALPDLLDALDSLATQLALLQPLCRLLNLVGTACTENHAILVTFKGRVVGYPAVRQLGLWNTLFLSNIVPLAECRAQTGLVVQLQVHAPEGLLVEAAGTRVEGFNCLGEETACKGAVCVEGNAQLPQRGEELCFQMASYRIVIPLVDGGKDVALCFSNVVDFLNLFCREIGQAEALENALLVHFVDALNGFFKGRAFVWRVNVQDVELLDADPVEGILSIADDGILTAVARIEAAGQLGVNGEVGTLVELTNGDFRAGVQACSVDIGHAICEEHVDGLGADLMVLECRRVRQRSSAEDSLNHDE